MEAEEEELDQFYKQLQGVLETIRKHDILLINGGIKAKVGISNQNREEIMGIHGTSDNSNNAEKLIVF